MERDPQQDLPEDVVDAVVIGGGAAGLNGALMLARSRRSVVVIDAGRPRNAPADAIHGLLGRDGTPPTALLATGRDEVRRYGGSVVAGEVTSVTDARDTPDGTFAVATADGRTFRARRLLITSGAVDVLPDVPGLAQRWGHDVIHCPYCHGWEARDRAIGVLMTDARAVHQALLFSQLSGDVVVFTHGRTPTDQELAQLAARGIATVDGVVTGVEVTGDRLTGLRLADGRVVGRDVVVVASTMAVRASFLAGLGLRPEPLAGGAGERLPADAFGRTDVPGVWVAGNVTDPMAQVGAAAAAGALAGAQINADLIMTEVSAAVGAASGTVGAAVGTR